MFRMLSSALIVMNPLRINTGVHEAQYCKFTRITFPENDGTWQELILSLQFNAAFSEFSFVPFQMQLDTNPSLFIKRVDENDS